MFFTLGGLHRWDGEEVDSPTYIPPGLEHTKLDIVELYREIFKSSYIYMVESGDKSR
ncbi:hypothetical protein P280DRAFT_295055 [Massarina eburnea CBS 473.64]|uniref:Uncharacterized protein n=1 Tax=Massarina eburnea CBS 473.64 TaxID=1395130 RepID=A0A6A6S2P4_9PLEO|nr:hypothetical protein P280DRAFT_295055 [Massarina eburnea CBS 473.64]